MLGFGAVAGPMGKHLGGKGFLPVALRLQPSWWPALAGGLLRSPSCCVHYPQERRCPPHPAVFPAPATHPVPSESSGLLRGPMSVPVFLLHGYHCSSWSLSSERLVSFSSNLPAVATVPSPL